MPAPFHGYSRRDVFEAGKIVSRIISDDQISGDVIDAFRIINSWKASHAYPMALCRNRLRKALKSAGADGQIAAREKRIGSIRNKLNSIPNIMDIQDIGGVRAIVDNIETVRSLDKLYFEGIGEYKIIKRNDYILHPKPTGYRSLHIVMKMPPFSTIGRAAHSRQKIEVQIRTKRQHEWSTAVEAIGFMLGKRLKNGDGPEKWLRFLKLMGDVYLILEEQTDDLPSDVRKEIIELNNALGAIKVIEQSKELVARIGWSKYAILDFNETTKRTAYDTFSTYDAAQLSLTSNAGGKWTDNAVIIQLDEGSSFYSTYPNYFLDIPSFLDVLYDVVEGKPLAAPLRRWWSILLPSLKRAHSKAVRDRDYKDWVESFGE